MVYKKFNLLIDVSGMPNMYTIIKGEREYIYEKTIVVLWNNFINELSFC